ncbi:Uncharacterised protein [Mycobacteroides abscessus subsp. abscessus]|nr:Uncharacterised protein [Mycobacteroides abscessus subsp. abscessus]
MFIMDPAGCSEIQITFEGANIFNLLFQFLLFFNKELLLPFLA